MSITPPISPNFCTKVLFCDSIPSYNPTTIKINFPPELNTAMDILLKENSAKDAIKSEARAALGDKISKFASHFSTPSNMWTFFDAMKTFTATQPSFSDQFNYTNQLALILDNISPTTPDETRDSEISKLIADFNTLVTTKDDQIGRDVATWLSTANGKNTTVICANLLQIVLEKVGFPSQQRSWADVITILQNKYFLILHNGDNNWICDVASSLMKVVPSELNNQGRVELVTLLQICITKTLDMQKCQNFVKNILSSCEKDDCITVKISVVKLILKMVQLSMYSSKFVIPVDLFKIMGEIRPTEAIVNFSGLMMSYVQEILQNCGDTGYVEEMVRTLSLADLEGLFIGDVVDGAVAMTINQLHPIDSKVYPDVFKVLGKNNGKLTLTKKSAGQLLTSAKHVIEPENLNNFAQLVFQLIEIFAGSDQNFVNVALKDKFVSDFGNLFKNRLVERAGKTIRPLHIFCTPFTALIKLGFNSDDAAFKRIDDYKTRQLSGMENDEKIAYRDMMSAAVEKWHESLSLKIQLDWWKGILQDEHFDDNGALANAILTNIPFSEEAWDFLLKEIVWKGTPSREENIYRVLITLANNSKFPRSRVTHVVQHRYCKLTLLFFAAWINDLKNENISPEVEQVFNFGTNFEDRTKATDADNLIALLSKFGESDSAAEIQLFFDLHESLIIRAKGGTLSSPSWVKWMIWQIMLVFATNMENFDKGSMDKVNAESVRLGVKLLLDFPMEKGTPLEIGESELTLMVWQLGQLKGVEWLTEEVNGDIGTVQDNISKVRG